MSCEIGPGIRVKLWIWGCYSNLNACQKLMQEKKKKKKKNITPIIITYQMQHSACKDAVNCKVDPSLHVK